MGGVRSVVVVGGGVLSGAARGWGGGTGPGGAGTVVVRRGFGIGEEARHGLVGCCYAVLCCVVLMVLCAAAI